MLKGVATLDVGGIEDARHKQSAEDIANLGLPNLHILINHVKDFPELQVWIQIDAEILMVIKPFGVTPLIHIKEWSFASLLVHPVNKIEA